MDKFLLLKYKPKTIPNIAISFDYYRDFIYKYGSRSTNYYNQEYGHSLDDAKNAFAHAVWVVSELSSNRQDRELLESLTSDYKNLLHCFKNGFGNKDDVFILTQIMLQHGLYREVSIILTEYRKTYENNISVEEENKSVRIRALDFDNLYIKAGDYALFTLFDLEIATLFYSLASYNWNIKGYDWFENNELKSHISREQKDRWSLKVKAFVALLFEYSNIDYSCFNINKNIKDQLIEEYDICISSIKTYSKEAIDFIDGFIKKFGASIDTSYDYSVLFNYMIGSLRLNYAMQVLFFLSFENKTTKAELKDEIIKMFHDQSDKRYGTFIDSLKKNNVSLDSIFRFVNLDYCENKLLSILRVPSHNIEYAYYTSYSTFSFMLPEHCINGKYDECGKLSIMNISYMNDPNEGKTLRRFIYKGKEAPKSSHTREILKTQYVFAKCFTSMIDYLPMWQMYGDRGEGICLIIDFSNMKDTQLYNVCYIKSKDTRFQVLQTDNKAIKESYSQVESLLEEISNIYSKISDDNEKKTFDSLLDKIAFLFKDSSYSYEQEIRIMYSFDKRSEVFKHTNQNPPKLYINSKDPVFIKEIILGPKFSNIVDTRPYLQEQLEKMSEMTGFDVPLVSISNIDFR